MRCTNTEKIRRIDLWFWLAFAFVVSIFCLMITVVLVSRKQWREDREYLDRLEKIVDKNKEQVINVKYLK